MGESSVHTRDCRNPDRGALTMVTEMDPRTMGDMGSPALKIWKRVDWASCPEQLGRIYGGHENGQDPQAIRIHDTTGPGVVPEDAETFGSLVIRHQTAAARPSPTAWPICHLGWGHASPASALRAHASPSPRHHLAASTQARHRTGRTRVVCGGRRFVLAESDIKRQRWHFPLEGLKPDRH